METSNVFKFEITSILIISIFISVARFHEDLKSTFSTSPGFANILIYPLIWYWLLHRNHAWEKSFLRFSSEYYLSVLRSSWQSLILFASFAYIIKDSISRLWLASNTVVITIFLMIFRFFYRNYMINRSEVLKSTKYLYIGEPENEISSKEYFSSYYGFSPLYVHMLPPKLESADEWFKKFAERIEHEKGLFGIIISVGAIQDASLLRQIADFRRDKVVDFLLETRLGPIIDRFETLESPLLMRVRQSPIVSDGAFLKRIFDIILSTVLILVFLPFFLIVPMLIKLSSPGPVLYIDNRVGQDLKIFRFPKFRTMNQGSDVLREKILGTADHGIIERYKSDPRIFPLGKFLRRWSLDELPQLWNVLMGSMSIVGPRPILEEELEQVERKHEIRFMAKPGLTGLWQVTGRKEVAWKDRMVRDISYIDNWSLSYDFLLIAKTFHAVIKGEGAR